MGVVRPGTHRQTSAPSASRCQVARRTGFAAASNSALVVSTSSVLGAGRAGVAMVMSLSSLVTNSSVRTCLRPKLCSKCRDYSVVCVSHTTGDSSAFAHCAHRCGHVVSDGRQSPTRRGHTNPVTADGHDSKRNPSPCHSSGPSWTAKALMVSNDVRPAIGDRAR